MPGKSTLKTEVIADFAAGSGDAFLAIYDHYLGRVTAHGRKVLGDENLVADFAQDFFATLWQKRSRFEKANNFDSSILTILRPLLSDYHQTLATRDSAYREWAYSKSVGNDSSLFPEDDDIMEQINSAITRLPRQQEMIFRLSREGNLSVKEIAQELGLSVQTVRRYIFLSVKSLRRMLRPEDTPLNSSTSLQQTSEHAGIFGKPLYDLSSLIEVPKIEIVKAVPPIVLNTSDRLVESLKKQPGNVLNLKPREFEQLLAELLRDMGYEVELTQQTRDGGADILAYLNTKIGRLLFLVEAKRWKERKVDVGVVRELYGTLQHRQANSAILVTSSTFTRDAKEFQRMHQYQLNLRDFTDLVSWIMTYGTKK